MKDDSFPIPPVLCPTCGYFMDRASHALVEKDKGPPNVGDVTICLNCGEFLKFTLGLALVKIHEETLLDLEPIKGLKLLQARAFVRQRGPIDRNTKN